MSQFSQIPVLSLSAARSPTTKPQFLTDLRTALLEVGFLYLSETGLPQDLIDSVIKQCHEFFELPEAEKLRIEMKNKGSFLGYSKLGNELTAGSADWREQMDLSTPHALPDSEDPIWFNLRSPNQWPSPEYLPEFRPIYEEYISRMSELSMFFTSLIAEAIGLQPNAFDRYFDADQQHKLKLVMYPDTGSGVGQGVGPHKDSMLSSYLLQASQHRGLQAQNVKGEWIDCPPIDGTVVVAMGQGMEAVTGGVVASTTHRVLSPRAGAGSRYSIPFFQGVGFDAKFDSMEIPEHIREQKRKIMESSGERMDDVEFTFHAKSRWSCLGEATFMNR